MALPFLMPRDQATEDHYRRLEQLLCDLYAVLRDLITGGAASATTAGPSYRPRPPPPPPPSSGRGPTNPSTDRRQQTPRSSTNTRQAPCSPSNVSYSRQRSARTANLTSNATVLSPVVNIATMLAQNRLSASRVPHPTSNTTTSLMSPILSIATLLAQTRTPHPTSHLAARDPPSHASPESTKMSSTSSEYCRNLGCELRGIADQFKASRSPQVKNTTTENDVVSLQIHVRKDGAISLVGQPQT